MHFFNTEKLLLAPFFFLDLCFHFIAPIELCGLPRCLNSKESACNAGDIRNAGSIPGLGRSLEEGMETHSSILSLGIPWTEEPGGLQSIGLHRVGHNWNDFVRTHTPGITATVLLTVQGPEISHVFILQSCLLFWTPSDQTSFPYCYALFEQAPGDGEGQGSLACWSPWGHKELDTT